MKKKKECVRPGRQGDDGDRGIKNGQSQPPTDFFGTSKKPKRRREKANERKANESQKVDGLPVSLDRRL
jgi:hypothetical protein